MNSSEINCKKIFQEAYEKRYNWPSEFNGYKGTCIFIDRDKSYEGKFSLGKDFKTKITNIEQEDIVKRISSQLFEVGIHRVKREFNSVHIQNDFEFINESKDGILMKVIGKNEGDKYRVKDKKINMVFRHIHGVIIQIFVQKFQNTGLGFLSEEYTSQQLDLNGNCKDSQELKYIDKFSSLNNSGICFLESRTIEFQDSQKRKNFHKYIFKDLSDI